MALLSQQHNCDNMATGGLDRSACVDNSGGAAKHSGEDHQTHLEPDENIVETDAQCNSGETNNGETERTDNTEDTEGLPQHTTPVSITNQHESNGQSLVENVNGTILEKLEQLKNMLETQCTNIPSLLLDESLNCLKPSTIDYLSYYLDPECDTLSPEGFCKDYRGVAEWIGLEQIFIKYVSHMSNAYKTREVLSKWLTLLEEPMPTIRNLQRCLQSIDRPDVLEDMSIKIARDAVSWKTIICRARTNPHTAPVDTSWQLTRHDVVTGTLTYYTCCLVYADEDEGMAQIFTKLYETVYPEVTFFLPQFDLKQGKYISETTAQVIEERCEGKVIFLISEYFFASTVCRFAVGFSRDMESTMEQGSLIPFNLTNKYEHVPRVLRGIAGIRWFRKGARQRLWLMLTDSLFGGKMTVEELEDLKERMTTVIEKDKEYYLSDPPYDENIPQPQDPISVYDPLPEGENSDDPSARLFRPDEDECLMSRSLTSLEEQGYVRKKSNLTRIRHYLRKKIIRRVFSNGRQRRSPPLTASASIKPPIVLR